MSIPQSYKIVFTNGFERFFGDQTGSGSPREQVNRVIEANNASANKQPLKLYYRDILAPYRFANVPEWEFLGEY